MTELENTPTLVGYGTFGLVHSYDPEVRQSGDRLLHLREDYTQSPLGLVVKRGTDKVVDHGYVNTRELELSRTLRHPNVVEIIAAHFPPPDSDQQLGLVMPRARTTLLDEHGSDDLEFLTKTLNEVLLGLEYVHDSGFIHRDLKPGNVLIYDEGARLTDFGFTVRESVRDKRPMMTTYPYCAPEQTGNHYAREVDLWSFGCVLFNIVCPGKHAINVSSFMDPREDLMFGISTCPCIQYTEDDLLEINSEYFGEDGFRFVENRDPPMTWVEYIASLGNLERATALIGRPDLIEYIFGGLLCFRADRRLTIGQLRLLPMFSRMGESSVPAPMPSVWTAKTSRLGIEVLHSRIADVVARRHEDRPYELRFLFTANHLYTRSLRSNLEESGSRVQLYVACLFVAMNYHEIPYYRSGLIGGVKAASELEIFNRLEALILTTCSGLIDQPTIFDQVQSLPTLEEIRALYQSNFTD